jgi:hypothetical protein
MSLVILLLLFGPISSLVLAFEFLTTDHGASDLLISFGRTVFSDLAVCTEAFGI